VAKNLKILIIFQDIIHLHSQGSPILEVWFGSCT